MAILENQAQHILFFDGVCGLCHRFVDFLVLRNAKGKIKFAALQGKTAAELLPQDLREALDTVVYYRQGKIYTKSSAALHVFADLGSWRVMAKVFFVFPTFIRNAVYDFIANRRYRWFGKKETCWIPTPELRQRFLS